MTLYARTAPLLLLLLMALPLAGCGYDNYSGRVVVNNYTTTTTPESATAFRLAGFGSPFTGNLLGGPLAAGAALPLGDWDQDYYDAQADMVGGDLVEWFDIWVGGDRTTYFDIY